MPIYEYACKDCGRQFEELVMQRDQADSIACKYCHSPNTDRLMSGSAIVNKTPSLGGCPAMADCPSGHCCPGGGCTH